MTIGETVRELHHALRDYIEATYHVSHPALVAQRRQLLEQQGVIHQRAFLESTPRYRSGRAFKDLGLDDATLEILADVSQKNGDDDILIHDPPWYHQAESTAAALVEGKSLVVNTGTGSGKTECFLIPILGKLAREAKANGKAFGDVAAVRAIVLYPMNALVNDQLGRLRLLFGDRRVTRRFTKWCGRPARFARYTGRTLYPGVRTDRKDQDRLAPIANYYVANMNAAMGEPSEEQASALGLVRELQKRGKWPSKPDLLRWFGAKRTRWRDSKTGQFKRCVTLPHDPELLTRHEVQEAPPDILVTNYSMLEYMLMRPLERPIFDRTREWLAKWNNERLLLVVDEAHLYRGAAGAEVALLLRRLRTRLGIPPDRLQVICTSASFENPDYAIEFGAHLTGKDVSDFVRVEGPLMRRSPDSPGTLADAEVLDKIDLAAFHSADSEQARINIVKEFLDYRGVSPSESCQESLHGALASFGPMVRLINSTMEKAQPVDELGSLVFEGIDPTIAARAATNLVALGSLAKKDARGPGLLPCRVHSFYRGLPGLWICMDPQCSCLRADLRNGPGGKLYSQPRDTCECGARVLELFTCRNCGTAYARAYTDSLDDPCFLWSEPGGAFRTLSGQYEELSPLDLLLEDPIAEIAEPAEYDLVTGRVNPRSIGPRNRRVFLPHDRSGLADAGRRVHNSTPGQFRPCAVCGDSSGYGRSSVQDHQTKGDQPFQALITRQIQVQSPGLQQATRMAPLRGRKVLVFSDSRQTAARLAPNLQTYSIRDSIRPLLVRGYSRLSACAPLAESLSLDDTYLAVLLAAEELGVRLRPELRTGESFREESIVAEALKEGPLDDAALQRLFVQMRSSAPPESLLRTIMTGIHSPLTGRYTGLESLALGSLVERHEHQRRLLALPDIPGLADSPTQKLALVRIWLRVWSRSAGIWLSRMPTTWLLTEVELRSGRLAEVERFIQGKAAIRIFTKEWLPVLLSTFTERIAPGKHRLLGSEISIWVAGPWAYCSACRTTQRPYPGRNRCVNCGMDSAAVIDPNTDPVFKARKDYYRASTIAALQEPPVAPMALTAAEHTAQLNAAHADEVFSKAEEHELLFQDVDIGPDSAGNERSAIDVLSCTTTMEVGIDIGALSGVSLRNMPPSRANYQQRSGRAGRRGNTIATVTAFGSADSHDEHYFAHPSQMIRGRVRDPRLTLDNRDIVRRHVTAYLLQRYHQERLPSIRPEDQPQLFAVLGSVSDFRNGNGVLNRNDLAQWLASNESTLKTEVESWLPTELPSADRQSLVEDLVEETMSAIDDAIEYQASGLPSDPTPAGESERPVGPETSLEETGLEAPDETGEECPSRGVPSSRENLLDRLLYRGILPRYAFPTDVASFHVFDAENSTAFRPVYRFAPSQSLQVALSEYAPGKEVWIANRLWTAGAIYSPMRTERNRAWQDRRLYFECRICHFARTIPASDGHRGETRDCEACGRVASAGPATYWFRPPGFAHPHSVQEGTSPDDQPARSYATHAKLTADTPSDDAAWTKLNDRVRTHYARQHLLVTNRGPRQEGYTYCVRCGLIEPAVLPHGIVGSAHAKPFPDRREPSCQGGAASRGVVLGTDFISDVLLVSMRVPDPISLFPNLLATDAVLRTLCEALTKAACARLQLEENELQAEYRPALTAVGRTGRESEIYIYDTLPGGAGFAQETEKLGVSLFEDALAVLESCPDACDRSCYRCLRSYKNKFEHDLLDRHLGASLLRFLLTGTDISMDRNRVERSTDLLFNDLARHGMEGLRLERNRTVVVPGLGDVTAPIWAANQRGCEFIVGLHSPLTHNEPLDPQLKDVKEYSSTPVHLVDELVVCRSLPRETARLLEILS